MKSAVLYNNKLHIETCNKPKVDNYRNCLVKILYCGICGSDISKYSGYKECYKNLVMGHEACGYVIDGPTHMINKLVSIIPMWYCNNCISCKSGQYQLCKNHLFIGSSIDGAFQEYITVPESYLFEIPLLESNNILGTLVEPTAVAVHAVDVLFNKNLSNSNIAIIGDGTIGSLIYITLKNYLNISEKQIYVLGKNDEKTDIEFDYCFECSGTVSGINKAINLTKYRGTIIQVGIIYNKQFNNNQFYFDKLLRKEQILIGSWNSDFHEDWKIAYDLLSQYPGEYESIISKIFNLDECNDAFEYKLNNHTNKIIIKIQEDKNVI